MIKEPAARIARGRSVKISVSSKDKAGGVRAFSILEPIDFSERSGGSVSEDDAVEVADSSRGSGAVHVAVAARDQERWICFFLGRGRKLERLRVGASRAKSENAAVIRGSVEAAVRDAEINAIAEPNLRRGWNFLS